MTTLKSLSWTDTIGACGEKPTGSISSSGELAEFTISPFMDKTMCRIRYHLFVCTASGCHHSYDFDSIGQSQRFANKWLHQAIESLLDPIGRPMNNEKQEYYQPPQSSKEEKVDKDCYIYFVKDDLSGLTKIGKTKDVATRISNMMTSNPRIRVLFSYRAKESVEKAWHEELKEFRDSREWFRLTDEQLIEIEFKINTQKN